MAIVLFPSYCNKLLKSCIICADVAEQRFDFAATPIVRTAIVYERKLKCAFLAMLFLRTIKKVGKIVPTESYERRADGHVQADLQFGS